MPKHTIHLIGNAHLDPIWLWRWQEGCNEVMQTFRSALDRLKEYDDLVFTCSSAAYYRWVEEIDPEMFAEIQQMVKEERWFIVNGWWVQPDCNMPSGESFARQALYSQLYYYEKFGKICKTGYNVDSFGHNLMLPQLLRQGGMSAYVMMRPGKHENAEIPENMFWWESPDSSRVLTYHIPESYAHNGKEDLDRTIADYSERANESGHGMMLFYGIGNHGGGPTRGDIEHLQNKMEEDGFCELEFSTPDEFFRQMLITPLDIPVWTDDLQHHASGCYSATSMVKQLNRKAENRLAAAEKFNTVASKVAGAMPATKEFAEAWRNVCFNQFHDILCGCSIMEAYEDVNESTGYALDVASKIYNTALIKIARQIDTWVEGVSDPVCTEVRNLGARAEFPRPIVVFNPHSFEVEMPIRVYHLSERVTDSEGNDVLFQNVRSSRSNDSHLDTLFMAKVPALGYATYWLYFDADDEPELKTKLSCGDKDVVFMENELVRVEFDKTVGGISKFIDKTSGNDFAAAAPLAVPTVIDDHKTDTWAHNVFKFHDIKGTMAVSSIELVEKGPLRASVRIKYTFNTSTLTQEFCLTEGKKTVRVKCKANWSEQFTMLKIPFDIGGENEISTYEIPCGYIKRPCNGEEEPTQQWADITSTVNGKRVGLAVINDSKYSYDCPGTMLRMTAIRNVIFADHYSPRPAADFNFTDEGMQRFEYAIFPHEGEVEETEIMNLAAKFNCRPVAIAESYHKGKGAPQKASFLEISADNIIATAFKFSEDGSGAAILRCFEAKGKKTRTNILCDMLDAAFKVDFLPHQIKTFRINPDGKVEEVNFLEGIVQE
ncbi:MAG: alpha-mannosidase [Clostridia bacterium]|nr:alpha-mannosidase [Clostridia bacterium]